MQWRSCEFRNSISLCRSGRNAFDALRSLLCSSNCSRESVSAESELLAVPVCRGEERDFVLEFCFIGVFCGIEEEEEEEEDN